MTSGRFLPYSRQTIDDDDVVAVTNALRSDYLTTGPLVEHFEKAFAEAAGAAHAVACNSGTAALHLAVLALDFGPNDTAIVPSITFLSTANAVRMTGAEVVFADVDPDSGQMTIATLKTAHDRARASGKRVKAAVPVHLNGQVGNLAELSRMAGECGVALIEDACHALGVPDVGRAELSRAACFSTHAVKPITTGEGGVVTTSDAALAERMRRLRSHGMTRDQHSFESAELAFEDGKPNPWYYEMPEIGWNYRLPDVLCALGISQLRKLTAFRNRRVAIAALYDRLLAPLAPVVVPVPHNERNGWHLYPLLIDFAAIGSSRAKVMQALRDQGIGTQVHYIPVHRQPYYRRRYGDQSLPGADRYYSRCLSIPFFPSMTDDDVTRVASALSNLVNYRHRATA